jgi:hypothetical protein
VYSGCLHAVDSPKTLTRILNYGYRITISVESVNINARNAVSMKPHDLGSPFLHALAARAIGTTALNLRNLKQFCALDDEHSLEQI